MDYEEYLRRLPKVELHCHVEGTLRPATVVDLARKHDIALPTDDVDRIYDYATIYEFLEIFRLVNSTVVDRENFARIAALACSLWPRAIVSVCHFAPCACLASSTIWPTWRATCASDRTSARGTVCGS